MQAQSTPNLFKLISTQANNHNPNINKSKDI